jgi:hypothetical protein
VTRSGFRGRGRGHEPRIRLALVRARPRIRLALVRARPRIRLALMRARPGIRLVLVLVLVLVRPRMLRA